MTVGIDEVGRGCWAGPLVAGAVVMGQPIAGLKDSKVLSKFKRQTLADQIYKQAVAVGLGWVEPKLIDEIGLQAAVQLAMQRALDQITVPYTDVIIDGHINFLSHIPSSRALIQADSKVMAVSAASIVAKVARDKYMKDMGVKYPGYGFEKHVGYGTALHIEGLKQHGVSDLHRKSYRPIKVFLT